MLDILVRELLTSRTLCQAHAFAQGFVVGFTVSGIQVLYLVTASECISIARYVYSEDLTQCI